MSSVQSVLAVGRVAFGRRGRPPSRRIPLYGPDIAWSAAFVLPYAAVVIAFALYPLVYGFWMASDPSLYADLFNDDDYQDALVSTLFFVGIGVNVTMVMSLLLSGFFMRRRWWIKALLVLSMLPWALPAQPAFISIHWILVYPGLFDALSYKLFGIEGPDWFGNYYLAIAANIGAYAWKMTPFWTIILLAGRMAIPQDLYDAAAIDGAGGARRFFHIVLPLLANLYLVCTLLCTVWMIGDFITPDIISGGSPNGATDTLATQGVDFMMDDMKPMLGAATVMSVLPLLIPLGVLLMRRLQRREVQL
jgi:multiple sugar transport system permease protein